MSDMTPESPPLPFTAAELAAIRGLWPLDPGRAFTNHGSYGAVPQPVLDAVAALAARIAHNPNAFFLKDRADLIEAARAVVGGFLHADPAGLAFVPNVTTAVSVLLGSLRLTAGDEVVTTSLAYGAVSMAMQRYAVDAGARVRVAELTLTPDTGEILAAIDEKLTARTRLVLIDQITSMTARLFDVAAIARPLAERGVVVAVDAAHAPGVLDLDVDALADDGVAGWIGNLHKWVCAPPGAAVLYAAPAARAWLRPLVVSWREEEGYPTAVTYQGTSNVTSWLAAPAAIALDKELGVGAGAGARHTTREAGRTDRCRRTRDQAHPRRPGADVSGPVRVRGTVRRDGGDPRGAPGRTGDHRVRGRPLRARQRPPVQHTRGRRRPRPGVRRPCHAQLRDEHN